VLDDDVVELSRTCLNDGGAVASFVGGCGGSTYGRVTIVKFNAVRFRVCCRSASSVVSDVDVLLFR
jgi:hypothetical protein